MAKAKRKQTGAAAKGPDQAADDDGKSGVCAAMSLEDFFNPKKRLVLLAVDQTGKLEDLFGE